MQASTCIHLEGIMAKIVPTPNPDDTRSRIMAAASKLFAEKGYAGTTTRLIADKSGVNEVTIFRHFGSKENLAKSIMEQHGGQAIAEQFRAGMTGDFRQDITSIGQVLMQVMTERNDAIRMAICEAGNFPEFQQVVAENPRQLRRMLAEYFKDQMAACLIHPGHPELLAQAFLGMFFSYTVLRGFLSDSLEPKLTADEVVEQFVTLFVRGTLIKQE